MRIGQVIAELLAEPGADAMQSGSRGREAQLELLSGGGDRVALERHEDQQMRVRFVQSAQARPQPGIDTQRVDIQRNLRDVRLVRSPRQPLQELAVATRAPRNIPTDVCRRHKQPRQHRPVHQPDLGATPPQLEERRCNYILRLVPRLRDPARVPEHPIAMSVKQGAERLAVTVETATPQSLVALHRGGHGPAVRSKLHTP